MYDMRRPYITQNNDFFTSDLVTEGSAFKAVHVDGSVDYINRKALGGNIKKFPDNYFLRPQFIAVLVVSQLPNTMICSLLIDFSPQRRNVCQTYVHIWAGLSHQTRCKSLSRSSGF